MSPERGTFTLLPNNKSMNYKGMYQLEFTDLQLSRLSDSLHTRIQRLDEMIRIFGEDSTDRSKWMVEQYCKEHLEVEYLLDMVSRTRGDI